MKQTWYNSVLPIAAIFSFRMLGLFMLIPVFTIYAPNLQNATPILIGIALGAYGLSQGLLQIPMGFLSDKFNRKSILALGLTLFAIGSLWGALTNSIYVMIVARALQGTGAIGSVLIALLSDLTTDEQRTKSMAVIGASIGISFSLAMVISPTIAATYGLSGIFYFSTALAVFGLILLYSVIPTPKKEPFHEGVQASPDLFAKVIKNPNLQRLNAGIFFQHFILTATFFAIPLILQEHVKLGHLSQPWQFYLPIMVLSFLLMLPFIIVAEKKKKMKPIFLGAVVITTVSQLLLTRVYQSWGLLLTLTFVYFIAFNLLEATLPSIVSRQAGLKSKGTAMGVYSTSQFIGIFLGGSFAGILYQYYGYAGIFALNALIGSIWIMISFSMNPNQYEMTLTIPLKENSPISKDNLNLILCLPGVKSAFVSESECMLYLKIEHERYIPGSANKLISTFDSNNL